MPPVNFAPDTVDEMHQLMMTVVDSPFAQTEEFAAGPFASFETDGEATTLGKLLAASGAPSTGGRE